LQIIEVNTKDLAARLFEEKVWNSAESDLMIDFA
jgi:hypothetical protein